ncbi:MAG TPA: EamA family transporter RarD [Herpetosiphonaceae bacterium]
MKRGALYAAGAYVLWGLLPLYWKALQHVPALEILAHRMAWSLVFLVVLLAARRQWAWLRTALRSPRIVATYATSALLLGLNWYIYIWAVNHGHIVEASLGYFINPLVNVVLGMLFLRERLRVGQGAAIALAAAGVIYLTIALGSAPWIALVLAGSFGVYGLLRKTAALESLEGLSLETILLFPLAFAYLATREVQSGSFASAAPGTMLLLAGAGVATAVPLLLFASGARRLTMTTLGLLQYIAPTIQFLIGVLVYHEELGGAKLAGFGLIWLALAVYSAEGLFHGRRGAAEQTPQPAAD